MLRLVLLLLVIASQAQASGREAFDAFTKDLKTFRANFEQSVLDTNNAKTGIFLGQFYLNRPEQFRWDYVLPEPRKIIADGSTLWMIDEDIEQVTQYPQGWALRDTAAVILLSNKPLEDSFKVVDLGHRQELDWLELLPKNEDSDIVRILIAFEENRFKRLELVDKFGQISRFVFTEAYRNPPLDKELFEYSPPDEFSVFQSN